MKKKCLAVLAVASTILACRGNMSPTSPMSESIEPSLAEAPSPVQGQAFDYNLKRNVSASVDGTTVSGEIRTIYNEDLGQVAMLVFRADANPQILLAETLQVVKGPVGQVTYFSAQIPKLCSKPLQVDFIYAPRGITDAMRGNHFHPSEFIDAEHLTTPACTPPPTDACPNIEGRQTEVPEGLVFDEETNSCVPGDCQYFGTCDVCPNIPEQQPTLPEGYYLDDEGQCQEECVEEWVEQEPTYEYGEWGECSPSLEASTGNHNPPPSCSRSRTVTVIINEMNSCTQEQREKSRESRQESEPCECPAPPEPEYCYYNIDGKPAFKFGFCLATGGDWGNWFGQQNHCRYDFPGISSSFAQLTPGQSESGCLSKHDD